MDNPNIIKGNTFSEVNLKVLLEKVIDRKWLFLVSLLSCLSIAFVYTKIAHPVFEARTSILLDPSGQARTLGESKYMEGGVGAIGAEKNLYNEIGILKSYRLIESAVAELDFGVSYYAGNWLKKREYYNNFPFQVELTDTSMQAYHVPYSIEVLSETNYKLTVDAEKVYVANELFPSSSRELPALKFSGTFAFGELVQQPYFSFIIHKVDPARLEYDFTGLDLSFQINSLDGLTKAYQDRLKVDQFDIQASILELSTRGPVLEKEIKFLKKLCSNFINSKFLERTEIASSKRAFIEAQLKNISDSLGIAERKLENFKKGAMAIDLTHSASTGLDQLQQLESGRGQIELNIKYYRSVMENMRETRGIEKIVSPSVMGIDDPLLNANLLELKRLDAEKTKLQFYKGKNSYDLKIIDEQILNAKKAIWENLRSLIKSSQLNLDDKNKRIAQIEQTINKLPSSEKNLLNFERKSTLYDNLYNYLNQELAKTGIASADDIADAKILDEAKMVGFGPVAPQKTLILMLAFIVGLIIPLVWTILGESFNESIDSIHQLEQFSSTPILGSINHAKKLPVNLLNPGSQWQVEESFRNLAANLNFQFLGNEKNIIGITSTVAGEGKSFCATNLAAAFAREGKKVLIIDLNFRHPAIGQPESMAANASLAEYLVKDQVHIDSILHSYKAVPNLYYIPAGEQVHNPHQLLGSLKFNALINSLRFEYDYIILDTPAVGLVSDYLLAAKFVDVHLYLLRRKLSRFTFLNEVEKLKAKGEIEHLFLVLNDVKERTSIKKSPYPKPREARNKSLAGRYFSSTKKPA